MGELSLALIGIPAKFEAAEGSYRKFFWISSDVAATALREWMGGPWKVGNASVRREGDQVTATLSRDGEELVRATITLTDEPLPAFPNPLGPMFTFRQMPTREGTEARETVVTKYYVPWVALGP